MRTVNLLHLTFVGSLLITLLAANASGQTYRWTDDDGTVHFSQQPPADAGKAVEKVTTVPPSRFRPQIRDGLIKCGVLAMSWPSGPVDRYVMTLARMIDEQEQAVSAGEGDDISDMRRCLIGWMEGQMRENRDTLIVLRDEYRDTMAAIQRLSEEKSACPSPAGGWLVGEDAREWIDCHEPRNKSLSKKVRRARELRELKPYWQALESDPNDGAR